MYIHSQHLKGFSHPAFNPRQKTLSHSSYLEVELAPICTPGYEAGLSSTFAVLPYIVMPNVYDVK